MSRYATSISTLSADSSRRLSRLGWIGTVSALLWLGATSPLEDYTTRLLGLVVLFLSVWPALHWAGKVRPWFPGFEISMLTGAPFYALPILAGHPEVMPFPSMVTQKAAAMFVGYQLTAILTFELTRVRPLRSAVWRTSLLPPEFLRFAELGMWLNTAYILVWLQTDLIPEALIGTARAMFMGIGTACTFLVAYRLGGEGDSPGARVRFTLNLLVQVALLFSTLTMLSGTSLLVLAFIGYISASRRLPLVSLAAVLALIALLHLGKSEMRRHYWVEDEPRNPALADLPGFYREWLHFAVTQSDREEKGGVRQAQLWERASLFQMLCLVVHRTPEPDPYLAGVSYLDIPALLIPRFLWPEKPSALESNVRLALYYNLLTEREAEQVSIAFGPIAEAFANFGLPGILGFGALLGWGMKQCVARSIGVPQFSAIGLFMILLTAWSFQVELVVATWITSLFQATVVIVGGPLVARQLTHR